MKKFQRGFTLIEIIIVIAIIGILAAIAIPRFLDAQATARGAKILADLRTIDSASTIYNAQNGKYPDVINSANPSTTDGFVTDYLASWPQADPGTFVITQENGNVKTFEDVTATYYTLNDQGRALYNGHTVEWYLSEVSYSADNLTKAISIVKSYLAAHKNYVSGASLNRQLTDITVDENILEAAGYTGPTLYWHTQTDVPFYYATTYNNSGNSGAQWKANFVAVNGSLYYIPALTPLGTITDGSTGANPTERMQNALENLAASGSTVIKLGSIDM